MVHRWSSLWTERTVLFLRNRWDKVAIVAHNLPFDSLSLLIQWWLLLLCHPWASNMCVLWILVSLSAMSKASPYLLAERGSAVNCTVRKWNGFSPLTYHSCFADGLRGSTFPWSSTGCCPLLHCSLCKESMLQCFGLAWSQQDVKQLSLLLDSICKWLLCGSFDCLEAQLWCQAPLGPFLHLYKSLSEKLFHVGQFGDWLQAEPAVSQGLACG